MKIICMSGSLKFQDTIMEITEKLELQGNCVLSIIYPTKKEENHTKKELQTLEKMHFEKIKLANTLFVVSKNGYIGKGTQKEIEFAKSLKKEIIFYEEIKKE